MGIVSSALTRTGAPARGREMIEFDMGERRPLDHILVVRADADADIERAGHRHLGGSSRRFQLAIVARDEGVEIIAAFLDAHRFGRGDVGLHLVHDAAGRVAKLQGCEADSVHGHVHGRRIAVQVLADHENRLAMGISAGAEDRDVGGESNISRDLSPHKVEIIAREPHVFAAAADRIGSAGAVILGGAGVEDSAHVLLAFKDDQRPGDDVRRRCGAGLRNQL